MEIKIGNKYRVVSEYNVCKGCIVEIISFKGIKGNRDIWFEIINNDNAVRGYNLEVGRGMFIDEDSIEEHFKPIQNKIKKIT